MPLWLGTYAATVVNNNDPLGVGRLQLNVPQVLGNSVSPWAVPSGSYYQIPANGTTVSCVFLGGDPSQPAWNGPLDLSPLVESAAPPTITYSTTAPPNPRVGDVWYDTLGGIQVAPQVWTYNSITSTFSWVTQASLGNPGIAAGAVQGSAGSGIISIAAGTITANDIHANSLTGNVIGSLGLCLNQNPFFSGGSSTGWSVNGTGATFSIVTGGSIPAGAPFPGYAAQFTVTAGGGGNKFNDPSEKFGVTVGSKYLSSAWVYSAAAVSVQFGFEFRNTGGSIVAGGTLGSTYALGAGTWTFVTAIVTAPATSTTGNLVFIPQAAATVYVQAAQAFPQVPGIVDATTITGAHIVATGTSGEFLAYSGTPALGNLLVSISGISGTDSVSNPYIAGLGIYGASGAQVRANVGTVVINGTSVGEPAITWVSGAATAHNDLYAAATTINSGLANEYITTVIAGPSSTFDNKNAYIGLWSAAHDGSILSHGQLTQNGNAAITWDANGLTINNPNQVYSPNTNSFSGNGPSFMISDQTGHSANTGASTQITQALNIPASDAKAGSLYKLTAFGAFTEDTGLPNILFSVGGFNVTSMATITFPGATLGATPSSNTDLGAMLVEAWIHIVTPGASGVANVVLRGSLTGAGGSAVITGRDMNVTVNTTGGAFGYGIFCAFTGTIGVSVVKAFSNVFERSGP